MSAMRGLVLVNGRVFTARPGERPFTRRGRDRRRPDRGRRGRRAVHAAAPPDSPRIDVAGRSILPGFVDAHHHLAFTGAELAAVDVRYPGVASIADLVGRIAEAAERTPDGQWIRAVGMNPEMFGDGRLPTRWDLDEATRVHPVLVQHMSGHHALANSLGLEQRGLADDVGDPEGGRLVRDERGRLTGYCLDAAQQLVVPPAVDIGHHGPGFHDDAPLEEIVGDIDRGSRAALAAGITSVVDAQVTRRELDGYRTARARGLLGVRVTLMPISSQLDEYAALGLAGRFGDDRLAIGPMKFYADGALTGGTAAFTHAVRTRRRVHGLAVLVVRGRLPGGHRPRPRPGLADRRPRPGRPRDRPRPRRVRGGAAGPPPRRPPAPDRALRRPATRPGRPDGSARRDGRRPAALLLGRRRRLARPPWTRSASIGCSRIASSSTRACGSRCRAMRRSPPTGRSTRSPRPCCGRRSSGAVVGAGAGPDRRGGRPGLHRRTPPRRSSRTTASARSRPAGWRTSSSSIATCSRRRPSRLADVGVDLTLVSGEIAYDAARLTATSDSIS